jgi:hypothetical protein
MLANGKSREFFPELSPRRGEWIAWGTTSLVWGTWIVLIFAGQPTSFWLPLLGVPLGLIAMGISLGNWLDRHTVIRLDEESIYYSNGLRRVALQWDEIQEVRVLPAQWGQKVQVFGERTYFAFHTLGEVTANGKTLGRTGFVEGDFIVQCVLDEAQLSSSNQIDIGGQQDGYYYSRD